MLFERDGEGRFRRPDAYPVEALATFNTHDLPSFAGWMRSHDLDVKHGLGIDPGESRESREQAHSHLREATTERASGFAPDDLAAVAKYLGQTPCRLVAMALDDILRLIRGAGKVPVERDSFYRVLRTFEEGVAAPAAAPRPATAAA